MTNTINIHYHKEFSLPEHVVLCFHVAFTVVTQVTGLSKGLLYLLTSSVYGL